MEKWEKDYFNLINEEKEIRELIAKEKKYLVIKDLRQKLYEIERKQTKLLIDNAESVDFMPKNWR
jgi:hypothetical protein